MRLALLPAALLLLFASPSRANSITFFQNDLRTNANVIGCGASCTLGAGDFDATWAQWAAVVNSFVVSTPSSMRAITFGFGGGPSGAGPAVALGGLEPYLSLFDSAGNFLASACSGARCPPGANSVGGQCLDVHLDGGLLAPGTCQIALTAFQNLSFAENLGTGTLADGFTGLGNLNGPENLHLAHQAGGKGEEFPAENSKTDRRKMNQWASTPQTFGTRHPISW